MIVFTERASAQEIWSFANKGKRRASYGRTRNYKVRICFASPCLILKAAALLLGPSINQTTCEVQELFWMTERRFTVILWLMPLDEARKRQNGLQRRGLKSLM